jgi:hypothetical protein
MPWASAAGSLSRTIERPEGRISRVQATDSRLCPALVVVSYSPIKPRPGRDQPVMAAQAVIDVLADLGDGQAAGVRAQAQ